VFVSDKLAETHIKDVSLSGCLMKMMDSFLKNDYGEVSHKDKDNNLETRYMFGNRTGMAGRYPS
jgi:hypothetical protein